MPDVDLFAQSIAKSLAPKPIDSWKPIGYFPTPKQQEFHDLSDSGTVNAILFGGARGGGKELALCTQVPTRFGWTTIGEVQIGDELFTEKGEVCTVTAVHPIDTRVAYRIEFDNGQIIKACGDHLWWTYDYLERGKIKRRTAAWRAKRRAERPSRVKGNKSPKFSATLAQRNSIHRPPAHPTPTGHIHTTRDIYNSLHTKAGVANHAIPVAQSLQCDFSFGDEDPYWAGTQHSSGAIPVRYMRAEPGIRRSFLTGVMMARGEVRKNGTLYFRSQDDELLDSVVALAASLGSKVQRRQHSAHWFSDLTLFSDDRGTKQRTEPKIQDSFHYIVSMEMIDPIPMRCITVDNPTGVFLVSESLIPTHNTAGLTAEAIKQAMNYPGIRVGCFRRTYPELEESFLKQLTKFNYARELGAKFNQTKNVLKFPNGSQISFRYCETVQDAGRYRGGEFQLVCFDEANLVPYEIIDILRENLRSSDRRIPVLGLRISANPGDVGHADLYEKYIEPTGYGLTIYADEHGRKFAFIQANYKDNPHLDADYEKELNGIADPVRRAAMRDGNWDAAPGQFFSQFRRDRHIVNPFNMPKSWVRMAGIDYGYAAPWAVVWGAFDNDNRVWIYREIYATEVGERDQARLILEKEQGEQVMLRACDPSMQNKHGTALSPYDQYGLAGCGIYPADNNRLIGWTRFHMYLNDGPACPIHREMGWDICPMLHVFDGMCPMWVRGISSLPRDNNNPDDCNTKADDHMADATRYMLVSKGAAGRPVAYEEVPVKPDPLVADPATLFAGKFAAPGMNPWGVESSERIGGTQISPFV